MKAYLINPYTKTVSEVQYSGDYKDIYKLISEEGNEVSTFTVLNINEQEDTLYVDDEGLFVPPANQAYFLFNGTVLCGKGLVLGTNEEGESTAPQQELDAMLAENEIVFVEYAQVAKYVERFQ